MRHPKRQVWGMNKTFLDALYALSTIRWYWGSDMREITELYEMSTPSERPIFYMLPRSVMGLEWPLIFGTIKVEIK
jgi:hypothetical protein